MHRDLLLDEADGHLTVTDLTTPDLAPARVAPADLPALVAAREAEPDGVRWVWDSTFRHYPALLAAGVRINRCWDLRLTRAILRGSTLLPAGVAVRTWPTLEPDPWEHWDGDLGSAAAIPDAEDLGATLFDLVGGGAPRPDARRDVAAEHARQLAALDAVAEPGHRRRLQLLLAAESSGALAAAELRHDGLPFARAEHEATLERLLGPRPRTGERPTTLERLAAEIRTILDAPRLNPDSQPHLLRELRRNGLDVSSTSKWELQGNEHPVVPVVLEYKSLARLASANGWAWMDTWVREDRFRSDYVPSGVVTGRWSSRGGGALSLPKVIRSAVRADEGWSLVIVDAAQLEPRILAAMAGDTAMLEAGARGDLYQGLVDAGVVDTREHAKVGMLGALYGSTSGTSGMLVPRLARAYPRALALVDGAARTGEAGGVVTTWLGRSSPPASAAWRDAQANASGVDAGEAEESRARSRAREWGRFTRNFVVQGTAAEWALSWMAGVRQRLRVLTATAGGGSDRAPHLAFFLHDELVVHTPDALADEVTEAVREAAAQASHLLFPHLRAVVDPLVPLDVVRSRSYASSPVAEVLDELGTVEDATGPSSATIVRDDPSSPSRG
ncbi:bifunctional 3'-5' exonuclease/DNA polymerase [Serinibacter arcticus]|uniref:DNA-directed DNA polymerase n=1 Tax=Serinibacter arcticus TaxID=1655435 RepID=A0A2U1ZYD7_9MICO|nr:bifunctional 3'-5' exonuclease/DNA polymerase [Serinibacter arcticus]PWD51991.1 bifunctional 3'-5' exonuclease/DNA polymerase [Serinibacter arcticus]